MGMDLPLVQALVTASLGVDTKGVESLKPQNWEPEVNELIHGQEFGNLTPNDPSNHFLVAAPLFLSFPFSNFEFSFLKIKMISNKKTAL